MAITTMDGLAKGLAGGENRIWYKTTSTTTIAANETSLWYLGGVPTIPSIPSSVAVACTSTIAGAIPITITSTDKYYIAGAYITATVLSYFSLDDRLYHNGGLVGNSTSLQSFTVTSTFAMDAGRISADSNTCWWTETYTTMGGTASSCYFDVTYTDGSTGIIAQTWPVTVRQSRLLRIQSSVSGKIIKSISGATLQATTGTAGSWGVTVSKCLFDVPLEVVNIGKALDFAYVGLPPISSLACLWWRSWNATTATGTFLGRVRVIAG